jgi:anti-sigma factor RsiW
MPCNEALRVQAYFDGELDAAAAVEVERHLESCAECAALLADLEHTRKLVRTSAAYHRVDDGLREKIVDRMGGDSHAKRRSRRWFAPDRRFLSGLTSGAGATALAAVLVFFLAAPPAPTAPLTTDLVNAHLRSLMSDHLYDVASSDRHTVKPWFAGHTDVSPPAADFSAQGFRLIGGRADYVDGHRTAVVVYRHGRHVINVFAWAADGEALPQPATRNGYHVMCWKGSDLAFCAVSDTGESELNDLTRLIRNTKT